MNWNWNWGRIKALRTLGGTWRAIQQGFGSYRYEGEFLGSKWEVEARSHLSGYDDESSYVLWHVYRDGHEIGYATRDPLQYIKDSR